MRFDNFWNHTLIEKGSSHLKVADFLGAKRSTTSAYFSGFIMPNDDIIHKLCEHFDIDFDTGKSAFAEAFNAWGVAHADAYRKTGNTYCRIVSPKSRKTKLDSKHTSCDKKASANKSDKKFIITPYAKSLYRKIPYNSFISLYDCKSVDDVLRIIYNLVDYDVFVEIDAIR